MPMYPMSPHTNRPSPLASSSFSGCTSSRGAGVYVQSDGTHVNTLIDDASFLRATKPSKEHMRWQQIPSELRCPVTNEPLCRAVLLPCCGVTVNDETLRSIEPNDEGDIICVVCKEHVYPIDSVIENKQIRELVRASWKENAPIDEAREGAYIASSRKRQHSQMDRLPSMCDSFSRQSCN
jgi:hypothetical protein